MPVATSRRRSFCRSWPGAAIRADADDPDALFREENVVRGPGETESAGGQGRASRADQHGLSGFDIAPAITRDTVSGYGFGEFAVNFIAVRAHPSVRA